MKLSKLISVAILIALVFSASSCGTLHRFGKDVYITAISPVLIPMAAAADSYRDATATREGYETGAVTEVFSFPLFFIWNAIKHTGYCFVYLVDLPLNLAYGAAEVAEFGPEIKTVDYYHVPWFDKADNTHGTDAETGAAGAGR